MAEIQNNGVIAKDFYIYTADALSLAAGDSINVNVTIEADSDFVLQKLGYTADQDGAPQDDSTRVIPLATLLLTDMGSGRQLMSSAVPIPSFIGDGRLPFILPQPKLFLARTTINLLIANYSAADTYSIRLALIGMKIFRR